MEAGAQLRWILATLPDRLVTVLDRHKLISCVRDLKARVAEGAEGPAGDKQEEGELNGHLAIALQALLYDNFRDTPVASPPERTAVGNLVSGKQRMEEALSYDTLFQGWEVLIGNAVDLSPNTTITAF